MNDDDRDDDHYRRRLAYDALAARLVLAAVTGDREGYLITLAEAEAAVESDGLCCLIGALVRHALSLTDCPGDPEARKRWTTTYQEVVAALLDELDGQAAQS